MGPFYSSNLLWIDRATRHFVYEGPTDVAAWLSVAAPVMGAASAGSEAELLALGRQLLPDEWVIVTDNDSAGREGASRIADALVIIAPVQIVRPPEGFKDAREWVTGGADRQVIEDAINKTPVTTLEIGEVATW